MSEHDLAKLLKMLDTDWTHDISFNHNIDINNSNNLMSMKCIGIGLTVSKKIIDELDGKISIKSTKDVGTEVEFSFKNQAELDNHIDEHDSIIFEYNLESAESLYAMPHHSLDLVMNDGDSIIMGPKCTKTVH